MHSICSSLNTKHNRGSTEGYPKCIKITSISGKGFVSTIRTYASPKRNVGCPEEKARENLSFSAKLLKIAQYCQLCDFTETYLECQEILYTQLYLF